MTTEVVLKKQELSASRKRNLDVAYQILCELEELSPFRTTKYKFGTGTPIGDEDIARRVEFYRLYKAGFIEADVNSYEGQLIYSVEGLTWGGCDLLDQMRQERGL